MALRPHTQSAHCRAGWPAVPSQSEQPLWRCAVGTAFTKEKSIETELTAIIKPFKYGRRVREALVRDRCSGCHCYRKLKASGAQKGPTELYRGGRIRWISCAKESGSRQLATDLNGSGNIESITKPPNTGKIGDGNIFVTELSAGDPDSYTGRNRRRKAV